MTSPMKSSVRFPSFVCRPEINTYEILHLVQNYTFSFNPTPDDKVLALSILKAFSETNFSMGL